MASKRSARIGLAVVALSVAAIIVGLLLYSPPVAVESAVVDRGPVEASVADDGVARVRELYVVAAPVAGHLLRIEPEAGDRVTRRHSVLARLRPAGSGFLDRRSRDISAALWRQALAQRASAAAEVERATAALALARAAYARVEPLVARGTYPPARLDEARASRDAAAAVLAAARAALRAATEAADAARAQMAMPAPDDAAGGEIALRAPISGTVLRLLRESDATVAAGEPLLEIGDPDGDLEVVADLLSTDAVQIRPGATAYIEGWGGPRVLRGRVWRIEPFAFQKISALGVEEQRVNVRIALIGDDARRARLGHGYRVDVRVVTGRADAAARVPASALLRDKGAWSVFVIVDGRARRRAVDIGLMNDRVAEVRAGLRPGDRVILFPGDTIDDGSRVTDRPA